MTLSHRIAGADGVQIRAAYVLTSEVAKVALNARCYPTVGGRPGSSVVNPSTDPYESL